jgi:hypothetical protein
VKPQKTWPCEHIMELYVGEFRFRLEGNRFYIPDNWSICPVKGCGARRPSKRKVK